MIHFLHQSCRETDLVSVGRVAARSTAHQLLLGELAAHRVLHGHGRICRARDAHRLIHVCAPGERIADRTAKTGCRAAKRFDLCRVIVRLVLEVDEPLLRDDTLSVLLVDLHRYDDRTGIDLVRLLHIFQSAILFQLSHRHERQIHQADILVLSAGKDLLAHGKILFVGRLDRLRVVPLLKCNIAQLRGECGVTAVVRPIGVEHSDLRHRRIPVLLIPKIPLDVLKILERHGKTQRIVELPQIVLRHIRKAVKAPHIRRLPERLHQRLRLLQSCLP